MPGKTKVGRSYFHTAKKNNYICLQKKCNHFFENNRSFYSIGVIQVRRMDEIDILSKPQHSSISDNSNPAG